MELSSPKIKTFLTLCNPNHKILSWKNLFFSRKSPTLKKFLISNFYILWNFLALKDLITLFYTLNKTLLGETECLSNLYYLVATQASNFLIHLLFLNAVSQDTFGTLLHTVQYLFELWNVMSHHWSLSISHPTLPKEAEVFPRGGKYPKGVFLPPFLT